MTGPSHGDTQRDRMSALIDGALPAEQAEALTRELEENPEMAEQIARMRRNDELLRQAVPLDETVPQDLLERLGLGEPELAGPELAGPDSNIVSLAEVRARKTGGNAAPRSPQFGGWRALTGLAAAICVAVIGANWSAAPDPAQPDAAYRTLSSAARPGQVQPNALVVFAAPLNKAEATKRVAAVGAQLVGDETPAGAWKLSVAPQQRDAVLARLRALPGVSMAEPLDGATQ